MQGDLVPFPALFGFEVQEKLFRAHERDHHKAIGNSHDVSALDECLIHFLLTREAFVETDELVLNYHEGSLFLWYFLVLITQLREEGEKQREVRVLVFAFVLDY